MPLFLERTALLQNEMAKSSAQMGIFLERMAIFLERTALLQNEMAIFSAQMAIF